MPAGIRLLCAMRPTYPHLSWIEARSPARRIDLDDSRWAASNEAVVRAFWEAVATEYRPPLSPATMAAAIAAAEGNVLHAVMLHDALQGMPAPERRVELIPRGLGALIGEVWDRATSQESVRAGLGLLCAAQEALSLDALTALTGWSYEEKQRFVHEARQLLLEEPASWAGVMAYRLRHDWVREFVAGQLGAAIIRTHHGTLARKLATWPAPMEATARRYALRHALLHRAEAGEWADAWHLAADMSFLEAKCRELGAHEAEADVAWVAERCRASGDEVLRGRFADLARALGRESHWLRAAPEAIAALVWNRLRRSGWSTDDVDRELRAPAEASFLRVRHVATRESPALVRDLVGHSDQVIGCAVTPDGRRVISASQDRTLKVWDLESHACLLTHRADAAYAAVTATASAIIAGDAAGSVWFLDWPSSKRCESSICGSHGSDDQRGSSPDNEASSPRPPMKKHTILLLAANPSGTDPRALDREARAIQVELERSGFRDRFELVTRWAAEPLDLLRELRKLKPTVVHFSGRGGPDAVGEPRPDPAPRRDVVVELSPYGDDGDEPRHGLYFQRPDGGPQLVSTAALEETFGAAGASVKLVVLDACYSEVQAKALLAHVDCVVGMGGSIRDDAARSFAVGFYGGLGEGESVATACKQGCAAISLEGLPDGDRPQLEVRTGMDATRLVLAADPPP